MREVQARPKRYGTMTMSMDSMIFWYRFYMESKDVMVLYGFLGIFMSPKPRVC